MDSTSTAIVTAAGSAFTTIAPLVTTIGAVVLVSSVVVLFVDLIHRMVGGMK